MKDVESRADIVKMLGEFYTKVFQDTLIGHFFTDVVAVDLVSHMPVIADFWESILFNTHSYRKNVMEVHQHIHQLSNIKREHLDRWVKLFMETVDELFEGEKATLIKQRASSIATLMDIKLNHNQINQL